MELTDFVIEALNGIEQQITRSLDGLSHHELTWRPGPECNSIGLILFHTSRLEDTVVQARLQGKPEVWETGRCYQRMNLPAGATGHGHTVATLAAFVVPELREMVDYAKAVRARTIDYLKNVQPAELNRVISTPRGDRTIRGTIGRMLTHIAEHAGDISYVRGIQRGLGK
ncbi:MAG: DinB family protein [Chloroflexi bacterium]|nr:DinB family protein [Chloroflexota bacterium]